MLFCHVNNRAELCSHSRKYRLKYSSVTNIYENQYKKFSFSFNRY